MDLRPVPALESDVFDAAELQLREQCLVVRGELAQPPILQCMDLGQCAVVGLEKRRVSGCRGQRRDDEPTRGLFGRDLTAREIDSSGVNGAVVLNGNRDGRRVGGEGEGRHRAIELVRQGARRTAGGRNREKTVLHVRVVLRLESL